MEGITGYIIGACFGFILGIIGTNCKEPKYYCDCYPTYPVTTDDRCSDCGKPIKHLKKY